MRVRGKNYQTVWMEGCTVRMIDQHQLPHKFEIASFNSFRDTAKAIKDMVVRGAGAIGAAAGYAMAQGVLEATEAHFEESVDAAAHVICMTRPTARDLFAAVERVQVAAKAMASPSLARQAAVKAATVFAQENVKACQAIGRVGAKLLHDGVRILTHCNAGWLAFVDWGSALAPIYVAHQAGAKLFVYATETRPRSQGAKLTEWELSQAGVPHALVADTAAGSLFQRGAINAVIVGADRIAANGDVANKIGTYTLAVLAERHGVPFYVAAPRSTFDPATSDGAAIPIEERSEDEVLWVSGITERGTTEHVRVAASGAHALNPAFDVTPAALVTKFITESGLLDSHPSAIAAFVRS